MQNAIGRNGKQEANKLWKSMWKLPMRNLQPRKPRHPPMAMVPVVKATLKNLPASKVFNLSCNLRRLYFSLSRKKEKMFGSVQGAGDKSLLTELLTRSTLQQNYSCKAY
mmetsp:Transcript_2544/g.6416  ORF Transcript_2544/g.6416 Transcript_2544/m.6416 type:complete len:109 (-) Transcript_2544:123-449(-)